MIRVSITIAGKRLSDNDFTNIHLSQSVGAHHYFEIRSRQDANRGILAEKAKEWIGKPLSIGIGVHDDLSLISSLIPDSFKGIITSIGFSRHSGADELIIKGQSPTIVTDDGGNTRSFTSKGLQEIINEAITPYKGYFPTAPKIDPKAFLLALEYIVQYKESNFDFITRLANTYGEWFYYNGLELFFGKPKDTDAILLDFGENGLISFNISVRAIPVKAALTYYSYMSNRTITEESPLNSKTSDLGKEVFKLSTEQVFIETPLIPVNYDLNSRNRNVGFLERIAKRNEQIAVDEMVVLTGDSRNPELKIGSKIEVKDTLINENYGKFVITSLTHDIGQGGDYLNHFEAIPEEVETLPITSYPDPPFCEAQIGTVVSLNDPDSLGRVKVKFGWQEGTSETTPWIRVASPYTGKDKGFYIVPEEEDQVLVAFENNRPEKPYVLTGMYNGEAKPAWFDAKNKFKGFKSKGENEWKFDDQEKSITISAPDIITLKAGKKVNISTNKTGGNTVTINAGSGKVEIIADTIKLTAKTAIELTAPDVKITGKTAITGDTTIKGVTDISGGTVNINGSSKTDVAGGGGKINLSGGMVKLNS